MALKKWTDGDVLFAADLNSMMSQSFIQSGLNISRQLIDRSIVYSVNETDWWGDAYTDVNGQEGSVDVVATTATFAANNIYFPTPTLTTNADTINDPDSFTDVADAFDLNDATFAESSSASGFNSSEYLGKTFSSTLIGAIRIYATLTKTASGGGSSNLILQTYNGTIWSNVGVEPWLIEGGGSSDTITFNGWYALGKTVQGIRIRFKAFSSTHSFKLYRFDYTSSDTAESIIEMDIPTGSFDSTISSAIGTALVDKTETGANIQYKLTNAGGDDSGYLDYNTISSFSAFVAEPDTLTVKFIPKVSPTTGYPFIKSFVVKT